MLSVLFLNELGTTGKYCTASFIRIATQQCHPQIEHQHSVAVSDDHDSNSPRSMSIS